MDGVLQGAYAALVGHLTVASCCPAAFAACSSALRCLGSDAHRHPAPFFCPLQGVLAPMPRLATLHLSPRAHCPECRSSPITSLLRCSSLSPAPSSPMEGSSEWAARGKSSSVPLSLARFGPSCEALQAMGSLGASCLRGTQPTLPRRALLTGADCRAVKQT
jgi:hypothetical protein